MLSAHKTDLAVVRGDTGGLEDARSVLLLTRGVVLLLAPSTVGGDSLGELRNTTIGVIGGAINRPTVDALKQVYPFDRAKIGFQDVAIAGCRGRAVVRDRFMRCLRSFPLPRKYLAKAQTILSEGWCQRRRLQS